MLGPPRQVGLQAGGVQRLFQLVQRLADECLAIDAALVEQLGDAAIGVRLQVAERQVLQLPFQLPDAEPVGQRGMDVAAQPRQRGGLLRRQRRRGAHPRELARQQHEHHAQVAHDRQQQPAQAFGRPAGCALRVQGPHLFGRLLAGDQALHVRRQARAARSPQSRIDARQLEPQRRRLGRRVTTEHAEQVEGVAALGLVDRMLAAGLQRIGQIG